MPSESVRTAVLGLVQGVAEVVPVSSSAQLVLVPELLGWPSPQDRTLSAALLHAGSCAGIAWSLRDQIRQLGARELGLLAAASLPAAAAGLLGADAVEQRLGRPPQLAALLAGAGLVMWWVDQRAQQRPGTSAVGAREAAWAGLAQPLALIPGLSRSGVTLTALRATGVERAAAQRFCVLMSLPVTAGAAGLTLVRARRGSAAAVRRTAPGIVTAALAGAVTTRTASRRAFIPTSGPALYRLAVAAGTAVRLSRRRSS